MIIAHAVNMILRPVTASVSSRRGGVEWAVLIPTVDVLYDKPCDRSSDNDAKHRAPHLSRKGFEELEIKNCGSREHLVSTYPASTVPGRRPRPLLRRLYLSFVSRLYRQSAFRRDRTGAIDEPAAPHAILRPVESQGEK